jgi:hypothetical protein
MTESTTIKAITPKAMAIKDKKDTNETKPLLRLLRM